MSIKIFYILTTIFLFTTSLYSQYILKETIIDTSNPQVIKSELYIDNTAIENPYLITYFKNGTIRRSNFGEQ